MLIWHPLEQPTAAPPAGGDESAAAAASPDSNRESDTEEEGEGDVLEARRERVRSCRAGALAAAAKHAAAVAEQAAAEEVCQHPSLDCSSTLTCTFPPYSNTELLVFYTCLEEIGFGRERVCMCRIAALAAAAEP